MTTIRPRIVGSEMEWPLTVEYDDGVKKQLPVKSGLINNDLHPDIRTAGDMMSNGARYYADVGQHLEYATPEDTDIQQGVVLNEMAGELFIIDSLARRMKEDTSIAKLYVAKRVIDSAQTAWGYHMNLSTRKDTVYKVDDKRMHLLGLHLATSQPLLGAGMVYEGSQGWAYSFSQKIHTISDTYGSGTTNNRRVLINDRDESHSPSSLDRRLHITSMDAHISPWATAMSFATTSLILRAIEQKKADSLRLDAPAYHDGALASLARRNMTDLEMQRTTQLTDGNRYTNTEIQKKILEIIDTVECTDEEAYYREEWRRAVDDLERDVFLLEDRSDAIAKLGLLRAAQQRRGLDACDWRDPHLQAIDHAYGHIAVITRDGITQTDELDADPIYTTSTAHTIRQRKFARWLPDMQAIRHRMLNPPTTTRAAIRGHLIKHYKVKSANWKEVSIGGDSPQNITLSPYDNEIKRYGTNAQRT